MHEAVITGLGPVASNGVGKNDFWQAVSTGRTGIRRIRDLVDANCPCQVGGEIPPEWVEERSQMFPQWVPKSKNCRFSALATMLALEDAGLYPEDFSLQSSAIYMGVSIPEMEIYQRECQSYLKNGLTDPLALVSAAPHTPATVVSQMLKSRRNVFTVSTACTSGSVGINLAADAIIKGETDIALAGGVEAPLSSFFMSFFSTAGLVPTKFNEIPEQASRPFDEKRESGVMSEGAGVIILEAKGRALRRKARIYGVFSGAGMATTLSPSHMKSSFCDAMALALDEACLKTSDIDLISACAPGHPEIDRAETEAIKELFGASAYSVPVSSLKSMIGNPGAAAGPLQIIAALLAIENNYVPPTVNLGQPEKGFDLDFVPLTGRVARLKRVMVNLRGYGGGVSSLIISRAAR